MDDDNPLQPYDGQDIIEELEEHQQQMNSDRILFEEAQTAVEEASKDALTRRTIQNYERCVARHLQMFCVNNEFSLWISFQAHIESYGNALISLTPSNMHSDMPQYISTWIYKACDRPTDLSSTTKSCRNLTYSHALKMRAAASYGFAHKQKCGNAEWKQLPCGLWTGNPSLSTHVSRYMCSLQRRKVREKRH